LPPPSSRACRLAQLRREIDRIGHRYVIERRPASPLPPPEPPRPSAPARPMPEAIDPAGLLYREEFAPGHRFGREQVSWPGPELMGCLERLARVELGWPAGEPPLCPEELLFLDIETTGLSRSAGTLAFVIGLGQFQGGRLRVDQILLRDPAQEPAALALLVPYLERARLLVSFNRRAFDVPVLRNRGLLCRLRLELDRPHLDLLPISRRLFRPRVENCRLGTLERSLFGFERHGDIDGALVPSIYTAYLRTGSFEELAQVLEHNRLDVALLASLLAVTSQHVANPLRWAEDAEELLASGLLQLRGGDPELGEACLARGLELARRPGTVRRLLSALARRLRRTGRTDEAARLWDRYRCEFPEHNAGWVELAKYHEHVTQDLSRALELAEGAPRPQLDDHARRLGRLRRRVARIEAQ